MVRDVTLRIEKGFDFLGYHFSPQGLTLAQKTIDNFDGKALRLYEQEPPHRRMKRLGEYVIRWCVWASGIIASDRARLIVRARILHP